MSGERQPEVILVESGLRCTALLRGGIAVAYPGLGQAHPELLHIRIFVEKGLS